MKAWFEDLPLDFTRGETRTTVQLLTAAYPMNLAALTLARNAGLNLARLNQMAEVAFLVPEILEKARLADRLVQLLAEVLSDANQDAIHAPLRETIAGYEARFEAAALRRKPSLATLALLPSSIEAWGPGGGAARPLASPGFEKTINAEAGFADPSVFRLRLAEAEVRTARIDIGGKAKGSGFLVAVDLLLTNWHVVAGGVAGAVARFDHKNSGAATDEGRSVPFAGEWLVAHSPYGLAAAELGADGPPEGNLDFALVRLAEPVGAQAIGPDPAIERADKRGCYALDGNAYDFSAQEPLFILGHPEGRPIQFSYASPSQATRTKHLNRIRYNTNTEGGSSGSPVFNRDWRVVALHHAAGPTATPGDFNLKSGDFNQGIPIESIVAELKKQLAGTNTLAELGLA